MVGVAAATAYCAVVLHSEMPRHTRLDVAVGAWLWYWLVKLQLVSGAHTAGTSAVAATVWYCCAGHTTLAAHSPAAVISIGGVQCRQVSELSHLKQFAAHGSHAPVTAFAKVPLGHDTARTHEVVLRTA